MAKQFLDFLWESRGGIAVFLFCLFVAGLMVQWITWIFRQGRFALPTHAEPAGPNEPNLRRVIVQFFVNLINDFRHLLALVLVLIFAAVLMAAIVEAWRTNASLTKALEGVMATLGGLIGSIVGYYFGESAARKSNTIINEPPQAGPPPPITAPAHEAPADFH